MRYTVVWILVIVGAISAGITFWRDGTTSPTANAVFDNIETPLGQLGDEVEPLRYTLDINIDPSQEGFTGTSTIDVELKHKLARVWLHARDMEITDSYITLEDGKQIPALYMSLHQSGVGELIFKEYAGPGKATLTLKYQAPYSKGVFGLHQVNVSGEDYVYTQFEPLDARRAFPSFDEPRFKVPFDIALTVRADDVAVSNTPVLEETELEGGYRRVQFATTKPLPTYLLAFAVGPWDVVDWEPLPTNTHRDWTIPLRGIATKGKGKEFDYALEHTAKIVDVLEDYFDTPYPYEKLDLIAAPDMGGGAMENAGAIIYGEQLLLLNDKSSPVDISAYTSVHAHELAHQWFGNLVTPIWWDDIWLNEAFANWMGYKSATLATGDDGYIRTTLSDALGVMNSDSLISTRKIHEPIKSYHDINNAFDAITYNKGGAVLSMFENFLGEDVFREGVRTHMKRFTHGNASFTDFMESLAMAADRPEVIEAFTSFLDQPGVPMVSVELQCTEGETAHVKLSQARYFPLGSQGSRDQVWRIPVCLAYEAEGRREKTCALMTEREQSVDLQSQSCPAYVMPNADGAGYYRWSFGDAGWAALTDHYDQLTSAEKYTYFDSASAAMRAGQMTASNFIDALEEAASAVEYGHVYGALLQWRDIKNNIVVSEHRGAVEDELKRLYGPAAARLGIWPYSAADAEDPQNTALIRMRVMEFMALEADHKRIRSEMDQMARHYLGDDLSTPLNKKAMNNTVMKVALAVYLDQADDAEYEFAFSRFDQSTDPNFRQLFAQALPYQSNETRRLETLNFVLSDQLRWPEVNAMTWEWANRSLHKKELWDWARVNQDAILTTLGPSRSFVLAQWGKSLCSEEAREQVAQLNAIIDLIDGGKRHLEQTLESIELCIARQTALREPLTETLITQTTPH